MKLCHAIVSGVWSERGHASHVTVSLIWSDLNKCHMLRFSCLADGWVCVGGMSRVTVSVV